jgi:hypothetical protein
MVIELQSARSSSHSQIVGPIGRYLGRIASPAIGAPDAPIVEGD